MERIPLPNKFELHSTGPTTANLVIEPLFAGYGLTIGNALRRVLLSSLPGAAITAVKITGVDHEFSTLPGVKEDVVDILLNLKQVRLKVHSAEDVRLFLKAKGKKLVTAADIQANADVEIVSLDAPIATLTSADKEFEMELIVNRGRGYVPTEARQDMVKEIGMIALDAIYTPIKNVSMNVENVRVGQVTNFERVTLGIEADGSIDLKEAVGLAAQILVDHFGLLLEKDLEAQTQRTEERGLVEPSDEVGADVIVTDDVFHGSSEVDAPAPKKRGRPRKEDSQEEAEA